MFFSINKKLIVSNIQPNIQSKIETKLIEKENFHAISYSLRYGMFEKFQNSINCSSCGK